MTWVSFKSNTTGIKCGAGTDYPSGGPEFNPGFYWGWCFSSFLCNVLQMIVYPFSLGCCIVCLSSTYDF